MTTTDRPIDLTSPDAPYYQPRKYDATPLESTAPDAEPLPVVIVGGGPVGMGVAMGLAQRGIAVTVLEAADQVSFGSRAICISRHSLEVADRLGFGERLESLCLQWTGGRSFYRDTEVLHFEMPVDDADVRGPMVNVSQSEFEQVMVDDLLENPLVTYVWQARVERYTQHDDAVTLEVDTPAGRRHLRATWVVAADGGRSRMREIDGAMLEGTSYEGRYVIADIHWKSELPAERHVWFDPPSNPGSTVIMHRQPNDIWRIDYQLDAGDDEATETSEERIRERITRHLDWLQNDVPWTLEWKGYYKAHARALANFVHDRVIFAGDAAHLVPIFGVRGLNSGMEDAETLAWMLAAVVNGTAEPALLDVYAQERHAAWEQNVHNAGKSTLVMTPGTDGYRTTRDAILTLATTRPEFAHLINPRQSSATHTHTSPLTWQGDPAASGPLPGDPVADRTVNGGGSLNSVRGTGFGLFGFGLDAAGAAALADGAKALGERLAPEHVTAIAVDPKEGIAGVEGLTVLEDPAVTEAFGASPGEIVVLRPEGVVLARLDGTSRLAEVGESIVRGSAPTGGEVAPEWPDPTPVDEQRREAIWLSLSAALDQCPAEDAKGMLTRLALVLGSRLDDPAQFEDAIDAALSATGATAPGRD